MLLESAPADKPFSDNSYVFEPKIDGHRLILSRTGEEIRLWTRHKTECTRQYPELHHLPFDGDVVLDGEVCSTDPESGNIDFEEVMIRFQLKKKDKIQSYALHRPVTFLVWDILFYNGRDLWGLPLAKRRSILESVVKPNEFISIVPQIVGRGEDLWQMIISRSLEGMVAKRQNSVYVSRRSKDWLKVVNFMTAEVYLTSIRKDEFGWGCQVEENGKLRPAGIIELGVTAAHRKKFYKKIAKLKTGEDKKFVDLEPELKAIVKFRNWTRGGMLRTPSLVSIK